MRREVIRFDAEPVKVKLDKGPHAGVECHSPYGIDWRYSVNNGKGVIYLAAEAREALLESGAADGEEVAIRSCRCGCRTPGIRAEERHHLDRKKPRFTPGPYHVSGSGPKMRSIKSAGGRTLAYVLFSQRRGSECEATARVMAAAPDLLVELRSLILTCPCGNHFDGIERIRRSKRTRACERCASALAAIAKAEGH